MKDGYWFRSNSFPIEPGEDRDVNPGVYGRQLASWLRQQLEARGQRVLDVFPEDFGWCVSCQRKPFHRWIGCGNARHPSDEPGNAGELIWHCFPVVEASLLTRLFRRQAMALALSQLDEVLRDVLHSSREIVLVDAP